MKVPQSTIAIISKHPDCIEAKTRLRQSFSHEQIQKLHQSLVTHTANIVDSSNSENKDIWWYPSYNSSKYLSFKQYTQNGNDLCERYINLLSAYAHKDVVTIGSDCASLSINVLNQALEAVSKGVHVIGPAARGGFYLYGKPSSSSVIVNWESVFQAGLEQIDKLIAMHADVELVLLTELSDFDVKADLVEASNHMSVLSDEVRRCLEDILFSQMKSLS